MKDLEGQKAPAFSLPGNDGKKHSLDEFKGKTVVLFFYPKDSTPGLNQGSLRVPRAELSIQKVQHCGRRCQQGQH